MIVRAAWSRLRESEWWEIALRFLFGGIVTVLAGMVAKRWGPAVGGLFLAFPGIFPAGVTLVERHEREKKRRHGLSGTKRARLVAGVASAGAALGASGLAAFAVAAWLLLSRVAPWTALVGAAGAWLAVSVLAWEVRRRVRVAALRAGEEPKRCAS